MERYTIREIRDELLNAGHSFTTTGDTEVILRSFKRWELDALEDSMECFLSRYLISLMKR